MSDGVEFRFIVEDDDGTRNVVPVSPGLLRLGRHADNEVCLPERNVSRRHATVELAADGTCSLTDLGSYNGVFINGTRVQKAATFKAGDNVRVGDFRLELRAAAHHNESLGNTAKVNLLDDEGTQPAGPGEPMLAEATTPSGQEAPKAMDAEATTPGDAIEPVSYAPSPPGRPSLDSTSLVDVAGRANGGLLSAVSSSSPGEIDLNRTSMVRPRASEGEAAKRDSAPDTAHLLCLSGERAGVAFPVDRPKIIIGRTPDTDIALLHRSISREHSRIEWDGQHTRIVDLDSSNGTLVNGENYQEAELHAGDVVELGHIRLRFVAPGEPCVLTLQERAQVARELHKSERPTQSRAALMAGVALVVGVFTVAVGMWTRAQQPAEAAAAASTPAAGGDEAGSLLVRAQAALGAHNFPRAQALATAALAIDPTRKEAQAVVQQAASEERVRQSVQSATALVQTHAWADAFNALQDVPKDSGHHAEVEALLAQVRPELLRERVDEARAAIAHEDWDEAALLCDEVEALSPGAPVVAGLKATLDAGRQRMDAKAHAPLPHPHSVTKPAASAAAKRAAAHAARSPSHAVHPEGDAAQAHAAYAEGTRLLANNQTPKAIDALLRCVAADKASAMCYRALGIAYAKANNGPKAVHFYKQYLKVDPAARDAAQVQRLLQQYAADQSAAPH